MILTLTNSLTKKKEQFKHDLNQPVKIYVCGITPYDEAHIGHGRVYVNFDVLIRLLNFLGYKTNYVRNITDIDDKLINKAISQYGDASKYLDIANFFDKKFNQALAQLNCLVPNSQPRVTECIPEIIAFIQELIDQKNAYVVDGDVYFDITTFPEYGKLSGRKQEDLLAGARVTVNENKRHPEDFALWKGNSEGQFWPSPWGNGRPGWHIECSVMAKKILGVTLDIHGGGQDLIFPHHENEIAQSEALHHAPLAHFWLHNAFVNINKTKMSKSLGNIISLSSLFEKHDPQVLRYFYLQHHYRTPIDFSDDELDAAQTAYKKLIAHLGASQESGELEKEFIKTNPIAQSLLQALCDDLNTPKFLGIVFQHLADYKDNKKLAHFVRTLLTQVLGLTLEPLQEKTIELTPEITTLLEQREQARKEKDWAKADKIRDSLTALGYKIQDRKL